MNIFINDKYNDVKTTHYCSIDLLRGLSAIIILIFHYKHFFLKDNIPMDHDLYADNFPLYGILSLFYNHGQYAVRLFWLISGFVFSFVYFNNTTSTKSFVINRIARLYPLHIVTLIIILIFQYYNLYLNNHFQIYEDNDLKNFLLNLFFVYGWGFEHGQGFNNPIWSVTVEIIAYAIFWISINKIFKYGFLISFFIIFLTILLMYLKIDNIYLILECVFFFFLGVSCFIFNQKNINLIIKLLIYIIFFIIFFYAANFNQDKFFLLGIPSLFIIIFLFFAYCENFFNRYFRNICIWLGNISYGSYLWHIPIQIMILTFFDYLGLDNHIFLYSYSLIFYIIIVLIISHYSFLYIESPLRKKIQLFKK